MVDWEERGREMEWEEDEGRAKLERCWLELGQGRELTLRLNHHGFPLFILMKTFLCWRLF